MNSDMADMANTALMHIENVAPAHLQELGCKLQMVIYDDPKKEGAYIDWIFVPEGVSGQGYGTELLEHAIALCEAANASEIRLESLSYDLTRWYMRRGFVCTDGEPSDDGNLMTLYLEERK